MELITQTELAKRINKTRQYISKLVKKGVFDKCFEGKKIKYECAVKALNGNIKDFKKTTPIKEFIKQNTPKEFQTKINEYQGELELLLIDVENPSQKVQIIKDFWIGKLNQQKYEVEKQKYFSKDEIKEQVQKIAVIVKQRLFNIPIKVAPLCYQKEVNEIKEIVYDAINEAVEDLQRLNKWK